MANSGEGLHSCFKSALTSNNSTAVDNLGAIRVERDDTYGEKWYMFIKASGAIAAGQSVVFTGSPYVVTVNTAAAAASRTRIAGIGLAALTTLYYGWIQIRGHNIKILAAPGLSTSACTWTLYSSGGVCSINKSTQKCGCSLKIPAGVYTYTKVAAGKSTSGFINCW
jgi:hypothetical protein